MSTDYTCVLGHCGSPSGCEDSGRCRAAIPAPEGADAEPVAWRWRPSAVFGEYVFSGDKDRADLARKHEMVVEPLYASAAFAAQPQQAGPATAFSRPKSLSGNDLVAGRQGTIEGHSATNRPAPAEAHGLTQALADAIEEALMHANCAHTLDEDDEPLPVVDKLSAPGADTIETGRDEVWLLRDVVLSAVEQVIRERQVFKAQPKGTNYIADLHDTLNQIADALGVERGKPERLIAKAKLATQAPAPAPLTPAQVEALRQQDDCGEDAPEFERIVRITELAHGIGVSQAPAVAHRDPVAPVDLLACDSSATDEGCAALYRAHGIGAQPPVQRSEP